MFLTPTKNEIRLFLQKYNIILCNVENIDKQELLTFIYDLELQYNLLGFCTLYRLSKNKA